MKLFSVRTHFLAIDPILSYRLLDLIGMTLITAFIEPREIQRPPPRNSWVAKSVADYELLPKLADRMSNGVK